MKNKNNYLKSLLDSGIENNFQGKEGQVIPEMNEDFINLVSNRYIELFEKITNEVLIESMFQIY